MELVLGERADGVPRVVSKHRHALAVREVRSDYHRSQSAGSGGSTRLEIDHLDESHVEIVVEVPELADPSADWEYPGHRECVVDRRTKRLPCCVRKGCGQHLPAAVDPPQAEVFGTTAAAACFPDEQRQVARVRGKECRRGLATREQAVECLPCWDYADRARPRADQAAQCDVLLHRGGRPRADVDLQAVRRPNLISEKTG